MNRRRVARTILAAPWILGIAALAYAEHLLYVKHGWPGLLPIPATIIGVAALATVTVWSDLAAWIDRQTDTDTGRTDDA